jgi:hypothetical protein
LKNRANPQKSTAGHFVSKTKALVPSDIYISERISNGQIKIPVGHDMQLTGYVLPNAKVLRKGTFYGKSPQVSALNRGAQGLPIVLLKFFALILDSGNV